MIKNEKQYKISKKRLAEVEQIIANKQPFVKLNSIQEGTINSLVLIKNNLKEEVKQYESLKTKGIPLKRSVSIMQLPDILIQYKIAKALPKNNIRKY